MLKILIVDDEMLVRIGIKSMLNWEENGYAIIGEAGDGNEALEKIHRDVPDIILTDLMMNGMDGFDLIKQVRRQYPHTKIIVLSCHNDFENVKEAMKLGANDYIFKLTVHAQELLKIINSVSEQIDKNQTSKSEKSNGIVKKNLNLIKGRLLKEAIEKSFVTHKEFLKEWGELVPCIDLSKEYILIYISVDDFYFLGLSSTIKDKELFKFSMQNIIEEVFQKLDKAEVFDYTNGDVVALVNTGDVEYGDLEEILKSIFEDIENYLKCYLGVSVSIGVSNLHTGIDSIPSALAEVLQILSLRFFRGGGKYYFYSSVKKNLLNSDVDSGLCSNDAARLADVVEHLDEEGVRIVVNNVLDAISHMETTGVEKLRGMIFEMLFPFINTARLRGIEVDDFKSECGYTPYEVISKYDTVESIGNWFFSFITDFVKACKKKSEPRGRGEILRARDYIRQNLSEEIEIAQIAKYVNMSESYFSHLFKKETGISLVDYVNQLRIDKAKELLLQTDEKVYEIAAKVGFQNANYFSMLFKKITGQTPNEYRS